jgi:hypothetical protein
MMARHSARKRSSRKEEKNIYSKYVGVGADDLCLAWHFLDATEKMSLALKDVGLKVLEVCCHATSPYSHTYTVYVCLYFQWSSFLFLYSGFINIY